MKFFIKDFFTKCDQICSLLRICSHLLKKSLKENFLFCAVVLEGDERGCEYCLILCQRSNSFRCFSKCCKILKRIGINLKISTKWVKTWRLSLREKRSKSEFFWSVFSRIRTRKTLNTDTFYAVSPMHFLTYNKEIIPK